LVDRLLYRAVIVPSTANLLRSRAGLIESDAGSTEWGAGRVNWLAWIHKLTGLSSATGGAADFPAIWNLKLRDGLPALWDGSAASAHSVFVESAAALGTPGNNIPSLQPLEDWLRHLSPPAYPFPIDENLSTRGRTVYTTQCGSCHEPGQGRAGRVIAITDVDTDRTRLDARTPENIHALNTAMRKMRIARDDSIKTNGYVAPYLDGIWLRAPYLHNGSVSNLAELLKPVGQRSVVFFRGYDVYDAQNVGFVAQGEKAAEFGERFDTTKVGNGNYGHRYGTNLSNEDRTALIEYLKTK
jgi:hypothetical protein